MRILPLAFTDCTDLEICNVSAITHGHRISQFACMIYVDIARRILSGESIEKIIPTLKYEYPFDRLHEINKLSRHEIKSTGYVVDTLEAALWAISHDDRKIKTYSSCILDAVNLGGDTDTIAAITGGIAVLLYGMDEKGREWQSNLIGGEKIEALGNTEVFYQGNN